MAEEINLKHSYSSISKYVQCPFAFYNQYVLKNVEYTPNLAAQWGSECHDEMHRCIQNNDVPKGRFEFLKPALQTIRNAANGKELKSEHPLGIDKDGNPATFRQGYLRGRLDVFWQPSETKACVPDWKVAKYDQTKYRLETNVFSYLVFKNYPEVEDVKTVLVWLKDESKGPPTVDVKSRKDINELEDEIFGAIQKIEDSLMWDRWQKSRNGLCKSYCDILQCEHNGKRK